VLGLVAGATLTLRFAEAAPVAKRGNSSAERGQHTIPMITANSTTVTASHRISLTGFGPIALTVGKGSMAMIHPSAHVAAGARIADNVEIGPNCTIGDDVTIGSGCNLSAFVNIGGSTSIGRDTTIEAFASLGTSPQSTASA